jgi:predicted glycosyl hydrolase (DUF1957 family)
MADRDGTVPISGAADASLEGRGEAGDGMVRITIAGDGLVDGVELLPATRRLNSHVLAACIKEAMLCAQHDWLRQVGNHNETVDAAQKRLDEELAEIDFEYKRQLEACRRVMDDVLRRMED